MSEGEKPSGKYVKRVGAASLVSDIAPEGGAFFFFFFFFFFFHFRAGPPWA